MGRIGCNTNGDLDDSRFNAPMPWIGIYVVAASAACAIAMAADAAYGFRYRKFWFPCKFFSLNATTLTLIAVAIKFSVDLNTSMPHRQDQLAKVSSSAFISTVMSNLMPSLGTMDNNELMMNILALGILVITAIVNICIQLGTGVIFVFWLEHAFIMLLMLVLLAILGSTALAVPTTKNYFDLKYHKKLEVANKECSEHRDKLSVDKRLRESLKKYWTMAYTCCPQFVIGRSATCTASGAFCLLSALILAEAILRSFFLPWSFRFCKGTSSKWPIEVLAANSMYRICQTILLDHKSRDSDCNEKLFEKLSVTISGILRACLTNLHHVISKQCHRTRIEGRLESIRNAVLLFGRTENILKIVDMQRVEYTYPDQLAHIDDWKQLCKQRDSKHFDSCLADGDTTVHSDFHISIE